MTDVGKRLDDMDAHIRHMETKHAVMEEARGHMDCRFVDLKSYVKEEVDGVSAD